MPNNETLFDFFSYARRGLERRDNLTQAEVEQISRTVRRTPEVIVKVLSQSAQTPRAVRRHLDYIGRQGHLELETDDGERVQGRNAGEQLVEDWDLDLESDRRGVGLASASKSSPRLVHKILLSMPPGTPAQGVLNAARNFAREGFGLKHRYSLVLHEDEPHPHVHLVLKAVSDQGMRLNIKKETLREWRREFARHLRAERIAANATERAIRGEDRVPKKDGIYRAAQRGGSTHVRSRVEAVAAELRRGDFRVEDGKSKLRETRREVEHAWRTASDILLRHGNRELAARVQHFVDDMGAPRTDNERIAAALRDRSKDLRREGGPIVR